MESKNQQKNKGIVTESGGEATMQCTEAGVLLSKRYVPDHISLTIFNGSGAFSTCASLEN